MEKVVYFEENCEQDVCSGQVYLDFLDYAFQKTDYFMLVYINYYGKGYSQKQKYFKKALNKFKVKSRTTPFWPGTPGMECKDTTYKVVFYRTDPAAKKILSEVSALNDWCWGNAEDLAFFIGNQCWFYSVGHERIACIVRADKRDLDFVASKGLANKEAAFIPVPKDKYFSQFDENLE